MRSLLTHMSLLVSLSLAGWAQPGESWTFPGETIPNGGSMKSRNGVYQLNVQPDGNLVLYQTGRPIWSTRTMGRGSCRLVFQTDGNLVLISPSNQIVWSSNTVGQNAHALTLQDDGNLVIYRFKSAVWSSNTAR